MQRLQHQLGVLHAADGRPGRDHLWERIYEDQPTRYQLYRIRICHPAAHEPAGFTHSACKDEVEESKGRTDSSALLKIAVDDFKKGSS